MINKYKTKFIDTVRFMMSSQLSFDDNLAERLLKGKCINFKSFLKYVHVKDGLLLFKCVEKTLTDFL